MPSGATVTIGLPVFNGEKHLAQTLDSLLAQDYGDLRIVIADNASTDRTLAIARSYVDDDIDRVRLVCRPRNIGAAANYSDLARRATTPYFKWASADDLCGPGFLTECVRALESQPRAALAFPRGALIDDAGRVVTAWDSELHIVSPDPAVRLRDFMLRRLYANPLFGVIRTRFLQQTSLIRPYPTSDNLTMVELLLQGDFVRTESTLFYRRRSGSSPTPHGDMTRSHLAEWYHPGRPLAVTDYERRLRWDIQKAIARSKLSLRDRSRATLYCWGGHGLRWLNHKAGVRLIPAGPNWRALDQIASGEHIGGAMREPADDE